MGSRGRRRRGLRVEPLDGWPLDGVLVGVATLRTLRELFRQQADRPLESPRAWDLALWNGVTRQGSADALDRLDECGLVTSVPPSAPHRAVGYELDRSHALVRPLSRLFEAERASVDGELIGYDGRSSRARREDFRRRRRR